MLLLSCSNDLDVTSNDYHPRMIVYGLLDPLDTAQYIRINKSFLGDENAYTMAKERDSIYFSGGVEVYLQRWKDEQIRQTIVMLPDSALLKDSGIFAFPYQVLFKTREGILQDGSEYRLVVMSSATGVVATSSTPILTTPVFTAPNLSQPLAIATANGQPLKLRWLTVPDGRLYQLIIRFHYRDILKTDSTQVKLRYADWISAITSSANNRGGAEMLISLYQDNFFKVIASQIPAIGTVYRRFDAIELILLVAADDLSTYIEVNRAQANVFQEVPVFSNIDGGYGLFSSRLRYKLPGLGLSSLSLDTLRYGINTKNLGFY